MGLIVIDHDTLLQIAWLRFTQNQSINAFMGMGWILSFALNDKNFLPKLNKSSSDGSFDSNKNTVSSDHFAV